MGSNELVDSLSGTAHVRYLGHTQRLVGQNLVGILAIQLVLGSTGQIDVGLLLPWLLAREECRALELFLVGLADIITRGTQLKHILNLLVVETCGIIDIAVRTTDGDHLRTQLGGFLGSTPGNITETRKCNGLTLDVEAVSLHHLVYEIEGTITSSLRTQDATTPLHAFTRQRSTMELARQFLVIAEQIADFATTHTDIAGRHVHIRTDDFIQFTHKGLTESHHLIVALAADAEVAAALATAHRQCGKCVLEGLFEAQELQNTQVYRRVETKTAFIRANSTVELHAIADVHLHLALVIDPGHTESGDALRLYDALNDLGFFEFWMLVVNVFD